MKICIIIGPFNPIPPSGGGAVEKMWHLLALKFQTKGHKIFIISKHFGKLQKSENKKGILHRKVRGYSRPRNFFLSKFYDFLYSYRAIKEIPKDIDIIVTNTFFSPILVNNFMKKKVFIDVARTPRNQMFLYKNCVRLRANSKIVYKQILNELGKKYQHKIKTIPNPLPFDSKSKLNNTIKERTLLYVGRIHPEKGIEIAINAVKKLGNKWVLKIIGPYRIDQGGAGKDYLNKLKKMSSNYPIKFFEPIFNTSLLNKEYAKASIFLYPSIAEKGETFGLAPLEAMAFGTVPIVSNLECFKDFIKQNKNGLIFNHSYKPEVALANKIKILQDSKVLLKKLSVEAFKVNKSHSVEKIANLFLDDFKKIISNNNKNL